MIGYSWKPGPQFDEGMLEKRFMQEKRFLVNSDRCEKSKLPTVAIKYSDYTPEHGQLTY
jgi:hypothetical protein